MPEPLPLDKKKTPIKQDFKRLIAEGRLEEALEKMLVFADQQGLTELHNQLIFQSSRLEQHDRYLRQGIVDYDDLTRTYAAISLALLDLVNQMPEEAVGTLKSSALLGIREGRLKFQIMWILLIGKLSLFVYLFTVMEAGDIPFSGFLLVAGVIFPTFAANLTLIFQERLNGKYRHRSNREKRINRGVQYTSYIVLAVYLIGLFMVLEFYLSGRVPRVLETIKDGMEITTFENLLLLLALIESSLGVYVSSLVANLFKDDQDVATAVVQVRSS